MWGPLHVLVGGGYTGVIICASWLALVPPHCEGFMLPFKPFCVAG